MDGLSSAASAIAVVSLAIKLVQTVQEISKFLKNVQDAPKEVLRLIETLDQLQGTLDNVRQLIDQQFLVFRLPGSPTFITKAMENCEKQIQALETFASGGRRSLEHQHRLRRTWTSMRVVAKKQDIEDIQCRLKDAKMDLQFALSSNSWQLQMYHIQNTVPIVHQIRQAQSVYTLPSVSGQNDDEDFTGHEVTNLCSKNYVKSISPSTKQEHVLWYSGIFGTMTRRKKSKYTKSPNAGAGEEAPLVSETAWTFRSPFMSYAFQLRYTRSFGHISQSLNIYPVLSDDDLVFRMCQNGDLLGLQAALSRKGVSPFVTDTNQGWTLLHHAATHLQSEICNWLLQVGLDADATDNLGLKALQSVRSSCEVLLWTDGRPSLKDDSVNIFRTLAQYQDDISATDISMALRNYSGPPEGIDVLLSHSSLPFEPFDITENTYDIPPLAIILERYSLSFSFDNSRRGPAYWDWDWAHRTTYSPERKQWESLIQRLIHKGADLHVPVYRKSFYPREYFPPLVNDYGTPLDELFKCSTTPDEARTVAVEWLGFLASKGHDVVAYLKKEMTLHSTEHELTIPASWHSDYQYHSLRELQFTFDDAQPCVWWEWWLDPASSMDLLDREFKQMVKYTSAFPIYMRSWTTSWPFCYPVWNCVFDPDDQLRSEKFEDEPPTEWLEREYHFAMRRANRRLQKRLAKSTHSKGLRYPQMPGAWQA